VNIVQLIWEWYVWLFVVLVFVPAFQHPFLTSALLWVFLTWVCAMRL